MDSTPTSGFSGSIAFPTMWSDAKTDEFVRYHKERGWWEMVSERPLAISMYGKAPASGGGPEGRLVGGKAGGARTAGGEAGGMRTHSYGVAEPTGRSRWALGSFNGGACPALRSAPADRHRRR